MVEDAHQTAKDILNEHREELDPLSKILLERETIDAEEFVALLDGKPEDEVFAERRGGAQAARGARRRGEGHGSRGPGRGPRRDPVLPVAGPEPTRKAGLAGAGRAGPVAPRNPTSCGTGLGCGLPRRATRASSRRDTSAYASSRDALVAVFFIAGCGGGSSASQGDEDKAVAAARFIYAGKASSLDLSSGPCLAESISVPFRTGPLTSLTIRGSRSTISPPIAARAFGTGRRTTSWSSPPAAS